MLVEGILTLTAIISTHNAYFNMMKSIRIHPATYIFLLVLLITGFAAVVIPYLIAVILHELGHAFTAKKLGYKLNKIWILPYGACLKLDDFAFNPHDEIKIALAGPIVNICLIILTMSFWWIFPTSYIYTYTFVLSNFSLALFNLLPAFPLDGARALIGIMSIKNKRKIAFKIVTWINIAISTILFALFLISLFFQINISYLLLSAFLLVGIFDNKFQGKYSPLLYEFSAKQEKEIYSVKHICVSPQIQLYKIMSEINKHKYNIIYIKMPNGSLKAINETQLQNLFLRSSPTETLSNALHLN